MSEKDKMEKIVSLCKRRGFIFPGSEIYGGLANTWDYGPLGVELKNNIKKAWWQRFVQEREDIVGLDAAILMNPRVWEASGHLKSFTDPLVECKKCHKRFKAEYVKEIKQNRGLGHEPMTEEEEKIFFCPEDKSKTKGHVFTEAKDFNLMFKTSIGATKENDDKDIYLRPETAQAMFVDFEQILNSTRLKIPFGIAQIGKAFRNEITPGNFIFRTLEFEMMEIEYFIEAKDWQQQFKTWQKEMMDWLLDLGIDKQNLSFREHTKEELSHYSKKTIDLEYKFPFGTKELYGLAYRTDFDLKSHQKVSAQDLTYRDPETGKKFIPHVIEPTFGVDRTMLVALVDAYEEVKGGRTTTTEATKEAEVVLRLHKDLAPIKVAILPLSRKPELQKVAQEIQTELQKQWMVQYDETGSIGRRYRRQDEIGTPYCVTIDFETLKDKAVTIRDRDTMTQERIKISEVTDKFKELLS